MVSWRDSAAEQAQADLDGLLATVLPFAEQQLTLHGDFFPFGAAVSAAGETSMVAIDGDFGEEPQSQEILDGLYEIAQAQAGAQRAVAFVADTLTRASYAVRVELEHADGTALMLLLPYRKSLFRRRITLGRHMSVAAVAPRVWTAGSHQP